MPRKEYLITDDSPRIVVSFALDFYLRWYTIVVPTPKLDSKSLVLEVNQNPYPPFYGLTKHFEQYIERFARPDKCEAGLLDVTESTRLLSIHENPWHESYLLRTEHICWHLHALYKTCFTSSPAGLGSMGVSAEGCPILSLA